MATANARGGRRRWMLHEEVRAAAGAVQDEVLATEATGRKYDFDRCSASYACAVRLLPQRLWVLWGILATGLAVVAGLAVLDTKSESVGQWLGVTTHAAAEWSTPTSVGAWFSNLAVVANALLCLLLFGLRRHRLDDYRGQYRRWLGASALLLLASLMLSTGLHHALAEALTVKTGMGAWAGNSIWWLAPTVLVGGWVLIRVALDMRPCRLGLFSLSVAGAMFFTALAAHFEWLPVAAGHRVFQPAVQGGGQLWLLMALLAQIRFIKLDAAGELSSPHLVHSTATTTSPVERRAPSISARPAPTPAQRVVAATVPESRKATPVASPLKKPPTPVAATNKTEWTDGRDARDSDDDNARPLSKAERKRLRKEARRQAA